MKVKKEKEIEMTDKAIMQFYSLQDQVKFDMFKAQEVLRHAWIKGYYDLVEVIDGNLNAYLEFVNSGRKKNETTL